MTSLPPASAPTLLLVDDEAVFRERLARAFREQGLEVSTAGSYDEAVALASRESTSSSGAPCSTFWPGLTWMRRT